MNFSGIKTKEYLIRQWVLWAFERRGLSLYFKSKSNFIGMQPRSASGLCISDDEGYELDSVVSKMKIHDPVAYEAFTYYHLGGLSLRGAAKAMGKTDHKWALQQVRLGEQFFELLTLGPQSDRDA